MNRNPARMAVTNRRPARALRNAGICLALVLMLALLPLCAGAEDSWWICPECGQGGNNGNYCTNCGAARPETEVNDGLTQIPGETDRVMVNILRIDGSSYIKGKKDQYQYASWNATDEDDTTCWQFSAKNIKKKNPWLAMVVEDQTVDEIWIKNGNRSTDSKGKDQYPLYARLKEIRVEFVYEEGDPTEMTFVLSDENNGEWEKLDTGRHEHVYDVTISVLSVYKGKSKPTNACLAELMLVQKAPASSARPVME